MKPTTLPQSYTDKDIYVGIDVHKKTYAVAVWCEQMLVKRWTTKAVPQALADQLLKYFAGGRIHSVYEAGFSGFVLHRVLQQSGIDSIVVNPASVEIPAHKRVKTDKRDAKQLAIQLAAGRLRGIYIPSEEQEQRRLLSRGRRQLVKQRTAIKNRIRMKAHQQGLIQPDDTRKMSHQLVGALVAQAPSEGFKWVIEADWAVWKSLDVHIKQLEAKLAEQAASDPAEATYRSAPGVGKISARILANELGTMAQFHNERQLFSYTGLTPTEHSSGETVHRGHISKQGNRYVRGVLIEVAWRALRDDPDLARFYERLVPRTGSKRAIVAVARKLVGRIRAAFRHGVLYQPGEAVSTPKAA